MTDTPQAPRKPDLKIPMFGAAKMARELAAKVDTLTTEAEAKQRNLDAAMRKLQELGAVPLIQMEKRLNDTKRMVAQEEAGWRQKQAEGQATIDVLARRVDELRSTVVQTEEIAFLQEAGVYKYQHPLKNVVAYEKALEKVESDIKEMMRKDGGAILCSTTWTVGGSEAQGRTMVREISKLMLRAFNIEADGLVKAMKPYKLGGAVERLHKSAATIAKLGATLNIRISLEYFELRMKELHLTADYLNKQAVEKEAEREERDRLREERKAQMEIERERAKLEKERQHYVNALNALIANGDEAAAQRLREQLDDVDRAIADVDYRAANIRAGYVYVISNIGSFGERMVKIGMTRRLDPMDRVKELGDASVPFNFDVHALFFSKDAVGIESAMHERLAHVRVNTVNRRREFFRATAAEVKLHLSALAGELLQFDELPEALEFRQSERLRQPSPSLAAE